MRLTTSLVATLLGTALFSFTSYAETILHPGQRIRSGESLVSPSGWFSLRMQLDGNLVLYKAESPLWATGTDGIAISEAVMTGSGQLVLYRHNGSPVWWTPTANRDGSHLKVQDDGNVVIYAPYTGRPLWSTNTVTSSC